MRWRQRGFGMQLDRFIGSRTWDLLPADLIKTRKEKIERVISTGKPLRFEDGRDGVIYDNTVYPVFDEEGELVQLAIYGRDITQLRDSIRALARSEKELDGTTHAMEEAPYRLERLVGTAGGRSDRI